MGKVYKNQSGLRHELETGQVLTGVLDTKIKYIKPDGTEGLWQAQVNGNNVYYDFTEKPGGGSELDQVGNWKTWAYVTFQDGRKAPGEVFILKVYEEGT
jgi:hypothetical protein